MRLREMLGLPELKVYRCRKSWHPQPCWHTKCLGCGEVISAFDFTAEESLSICQGHDCGQAQGK